MNIESYNHLFNSLYGEKAWRQLHKNAMSHIEQILMATFHKTTA